MNQTEQTFQAANTYLRDRVSVPTNMSSRELSATMLPEIRAQSFFSARVAEARVLEKLRDVSDRYSAGKMDAATARLEIKNWLKVKDNVKDENIRDALMQTSRLNLILNQNSMQAAAVGRRELALDPEVYEALPYYRYVPSTSAMPRAEHEQFYGIVLDKKDPFWNTHTPPLDFNCKCSLDELTASEAGVKDGKGVSGKGQVADAAPQDNGSWKVETPDGQLTVPAPASDYVFDAETALSTCDMSRVDSRDMRVSIFSQLEKFAKDKMLSFAVIPQYSPLTESPVIAKLAKGVTLIPAGAEIAELSPSLCDLAGVPAGILKVAGKTGSAAVNDTVFANAKDLKIAIEFKGGRKYLRLTNRKTGAVTLFLEIKAGEWRMES